MSYIFEALQRAEAERSGESQPKNADSVAELLRGVEQEIARKQLGGESAPTGLPLQAEMRGEPASVQAQSAVAPAPAAQPAEAQFVETQFVAAKIEFADARPVEAQVQTKPVEAQVQTKAVAAPIIETRPTETESGETRSLETRSFETRAFESRDFETGHLETKAPQPHQSQHEYSRQSGTQIPSAADVGAGAATAVAPLPPIETRVPIAAPLTPASLTDAADFNAAESTAAESTAAECFADARVLSPSLPADSRLVCMTDQGGLASEKFRVLGLKLRNLRERRRLRRIVVTGTAPEEGKSLVAANLALNQSRSKILKTLLIDGDLRRPTVASRFGFDGSLPGLSECLRGERSLTEVVYKLNGSGLYLLPAGRAPENPLDLMQSGRLPELLDRLGKFFDWIIIDTPPVIPVADTTFWMKLADGVLVVIREGVSEKKVVERALDSFERTALLGIVVNSCSSSDHKDYYSRYSQAANRAASPAAEND